MDSVSGSCAWQRAEGRCASVPSRRDLHAAEGVACSAVEVQLVERRWQGAAARALWPQTPNEGVGGLPLPGGSTAVGTTVRRAIVTVLDIERCEGVGARARKRASGRARGRESLETRVYRGGRGCGRNSGKHDVSRLPVPRGAYGVGPSATWRRSTACSACPQEDSVPEAASKPADTSTSCGANSRATGSTIDSKAARPVGARCDRHAAIGT